MKFDLSQFKKIKEDDHTAVMQHPEGHHIVIAKSILSPKAMDQLKKLPMHKAGGGGIEIEEIPENERPLEIEEIPEKKKPIEIDRISIPQGAMPNLRPTSDDAGMQSPSGEPPPPPMTTPGSPEWNAPAATNNAGLQNFALPPAPTAQPAPVVPGQDVSGMQKAVNEQLGGIYGQAEGQAKQYKNDAKRAAATATALQNIQNDYQGRFSKLDTAVQDTMKDVNLGHIKPNHYVENMSTGKKVRTAIGLILGGMGGGLMRTGNPAMEFLNKQIDRDIESQRENLGARKTLLEANMKQYGNLRDATDMTRVMQMGILANQFQEAGAAAQSQQARGIAAQHAGALKAQMLPILQQMAWRQALAQSGQQMPIEAMPEEQRVRAVTMPGGQVSLAASKEDATKLKDALTTYKGTEAALSRMEDFMKNVGTTYNPLGQAQGRSNAIKGTVIGEMKNLLELGVLQEGDMAFINSMIPSPGQIMTEKGLAQLQEVKSFVRNKLKAHLEARLPGTQMPTQTNQNTKVIGGYGAGRS